MEHLKLIFNNSFFENKIGIDIYKYLLKITNYIATKCK